MDKELAAQLLVVFLLTQALGLFAGSYLLEEKIKTVIVSEDKNAVENSAGLLAWILGGTTVIILLLRFAPEWLVSVFLKGIELLAIFATTLIVTLPFRVADAIAYLAAIVLVGARLAFRQNVMLRNVSSLVASAGAGAVIGASLGVVPIIVFLAAISVYDFLAVFKTKHMVELAKGVTKRNLSFAFAFPTKEHQFELGTGDLVVPLAFAVSVLAEGSAKYLFPYNFVPAAIILFASLAGLMLTLDYASKRKGVPLPALPLQAVLMAIAFAVMKALGF